MEKKTLQLEFSEKVFQIVLIAVFSVIICLPFFADVFHVGLQSQVNENRKLSERPILEFRSIHTFPGKFQKYFNDTFAFRPQLIQIKNFISIALLKSSPNSRVIIGKDGWFFFNSKGPFQKELLFTNEDLTLIRHNLETIHAFLALQGIKFYVLITPDSQTIYPEYLPGYLLEEETRFDQVMSILQKENSPVEIVDPRQALQNSKGIYRSYRKYDTHWNSYGAFIAYQELMRTISQDFPRIHSKSLDDYSVTQVTSLNNDLLNILAINGLYQEKIPILKPKFKPQAQQTILSCRFKPNCEKILSALHDSKLPKVVMYRDSFNISIIPYLSEHFREVLYLWTHSVSAQDIVKNKPDIVIFQIVERDLRMLKDIKIKYPLFVSPTPTTTPSPTPILSPTPTDNPTATPTPTPTPSPNPTPTSLPVTSFEAFFDQSSLQYQVSKDLLKKIALCESGMNPAAVNGQYGGMFQFTAETWQTTRTQMGKDTNADLRFEAKDAIETAAYKIANKGENAWINCL